MVSHTFTKWLMSCTCANWTAYPLTVIEPHSTNHPAQKWWIGVNNKRPWSQAIHMQVVSQPTPARPHHLCNREMGTAISCCELTGLMLGSNTSNMGALYILFVKLASMFTCSCNLFWQCASFPSTALVLLWCRCFVIYRPKVFQSRYNFPTKHMCSICNCSTQNMHTVAYVACFGLFLCVSWLVSIPCFDNMWSIRTDVVRKLSSVRSWPFHCNLRVWQVHVEIETLFCGIFWLRCHVQCTMLSNFC